MLVCFPNIFILLCFITVALLSSQASVSSSSNPSKTNAKNFKKPTSSGPSAVGGKTSAVNRPKPGTPRPSATNVDRRKTEAGSRMNRRPYGQPEVPHSTATIQNFCF